MVRWIRVILYFFAAEIELVWIIGVTAIWLNRSTPYLAGLFEWALTKEGILPWLRNRGLNWLHYETERL